MLHLLYWWECCFVCWRCLVFVLYAWSAIAAAGLCHLLFSEVDKIISIINTGLLRVFYSWGKPRYLVRQPGHHRPREKAVGQNCMHKLKTHWYSSALLSDMRHKLREIQNFPHSLKPLNFLVPEYNLLYAAAVCSLHQLRCLTKFCLF